MDSPLPPCTQMTGIHTKMSFVWSNIARGKLLWKVQYVSPEKNPKNKNLKLDLRKYFFTPSEYLSYTISKCLLHMYQYFFRDILLISTFWYPVLKLKLIIDVTCDLLGTCWCRNRLPDQCTQYLLPISMLFSACIDVYRLQTNVKIDSRVRNRNIYKQFFSFMNP